jgi:hypothetical protein
MKDIQFFCFLFLQTYIAYLGNVHHLGLLRYLWSDPQKILINNQCLSFRIGMYESTRSSKGRPFDKVGCTHKMPLQTQLPLEAGDIVEAIKLYKRSAVGSFTGVSFRRNSPNDEPH